MMKILRVNNDESKNNFLDELIIENIDHLHIERMDDDHIWMKFESDNGQVILEFYTKRNSKIFNTYQELTTKK